MRDDFKKTDKETLAKRVGSKCSNPNCRKVTIGPSAESEKTINVGVAAHIKAASVGGKRFDPEQTSDQRGSIENGIWLCQTCSKLIDSDETKYTCNLLNKWKILSENAAALDVENPPQSKSDNVFITAINPVHSQVAHTIINQNPPQRTISLIRSKLIDGIKGSPQNYKIKLSNGDSEMETFAKEIDSALKEAGWNNVGFIYRLAGFHEPGVTFGVKAVDQASQYIADLFHINHFKVTANKYTDINEFHIIIGPNK